jgi:hypothetical protein
VFAVAEAEALDGDEAPGPPVAPPPDPPAPPVPAGPGCPLATC